MGLTSPHRQFADPIRDMCMVCHLARGILLRPISRRKHALCIAPPGPGNSHYTRKLRRFRAPRNFHLKDCPNTLRLLSTLPRRGHSGIYSFAEGRIFARTRTTPFGHFQPLSIQPGERLITAKSGHSCCTEVAEKASPSPIIVSAKLKIE